jgi:hypothetical protein
MASTMKGPRARYRFVIRRKFQCGACQRVAFTSGQVGTMYCRCNADAPPLMQLVEEKQARPNVPSAPSLP